MAIRWPGGGTSYLDYTGGAPDTNNCTALGWVQLAVDTNDYVSCLPRFRNSGDSTTLWLGTVASGTNVAFATAGSGEIPTGKDLVAGKWMPIAFTSTGGTGTAYAADSESGPVTVASGALSGNTPAAKYCFGARGPSDSTEGFNGALAGWKLYNGTLTIGEIRVEWSQLLPVRTAGLYAAYPMDANSVDGRLDASGNGRMLALGGTGLTTVAGPPILRQRVVVRPWLSAPGGGSVSGTAASSLGALTGAATGTHKVLGTASAALGALSGAGTGTRATTATSAVASLGALAATATGTPKVLGTAAAPLGGLSATATGVPKVLGTGAAPLGALNASGSSTPTTHGTAAAPLGALTATATGVPKVLGTAAATLGALTATATVRATASGALGALAASATGLRKTFATATASLGALVATGGDAVVPVDYPIAVGSVMDLASRNTAGTIIDLAGESTTGVIVDGATRYLAGTPT